MTTYTITTTTGEVRGTYEADSPAEALDLLAQDAGYRSAAEALYEDNRVQFYDWLAEHGAPFLANGTGGLESDAFDILAARLAAGDSLSYELPRAYRRDPDSVPEFRLPTTLIVTPRMSEGATSHRARETP